VRLFRVKNQFFLPFPVRYFYNTDFLLEKTKELTGFPFCYPGIPKRFNSSFPIRVEPPGFLVNSRLSPLFNKFVKLTFGTIFVYLVTRRPPREADHLGSKTLPPTCCLFLSGAPSQCRFFPAFFHYPLFVNFPRKTPTIMTLVCTHIWMTHYSARSSFFD